MPRNTTTLLDRINISSPCSADWDSMIGNREVRFCLHCSKHVNNLSEMTRKQALELVARSGGQLCLRIVRRPDGRVQVARPDSQLYQIKRRASRLAAGAFTAALSLCSSVIAQTHSPGEQPTLNNVEITDLYDSARPVTGPTNAILKGTVMDPYGAVIPGAIMTLVNEKTTQEQTALTDSVGQYQFQNLEAGTYTLKFEMSGFDKSERTGLDLQAGQEQTVDMSAGVSALGVTVGFVAISLPSDPLIAAAAENDLSKVKELIAAGVDANRRDENTQTSALDEAVKNGNRQIVRALLDAGAEINARNSLGQTALMILDEDASEDLVWDLVAAGAKINLRDEDGDTALILAASWSKAEILRALLNAGARVNAKNKEGETALMKAAAEGDLESVKLLIDSGAEINRKNNSGETALKLAEDNKHAEVVQQLEAYSASK
ncbi:MAG: ankyrin repeat domain-containing protein [Acidobacteria bacterium]|nr:ankyrin repeat domain-containing protein [Acidobacteriota bacterium]